MVNKKKKDEEDPLDLLDPFASPTLVFDAIGSTYAECYQFAQRIGQRAFECEADELIIALQPLMAIDHDVLEVSIPTKWKSTAVVSRAPQSNE